jgi:hypothetical protein
MKYGYALDQDLQSDLASAGALCSANSTHFRDRIGSTFLGFARAEYGFQVAVATGDTMRVHPLFG